MSRRSSKKKRKLEREYRTPPGTAPGTLIIDPQAPRPQIHLIAYGPESVIEQEIEDVQSLSRYLSHHPVTWINVEGLGDASVLAKIGEIFGVHRLAMEDVVNVHQRAKVEQYQNHYFIVARIPRAEGRLESEQLSLFLGKDYLLTFQERQVDCFESVRSRIRKTGGRIRNTGADYLAYALLDSIIDSYFPVLENYGERIEMLEDEVLVHATSEVMSQIHDARRDLISLRRLVWPLREAISALTREPTPLISEDTRIYLRDCYDHTIQIIDLLENHRDVAASLMEVYLSRISHRMNEVMKILTIFTTIFIPLGFIAGVYGMNFEREGSPWNMPELGWRFGYSFALGLMLVVAVSMLLFFRRKGWLGHSETPPNK